MKRFIKINHVDKENIKMINQTETGFDLAILSDDVLKKLLETINFYEEKGDDIYIVWQMKHKFKNFVVYKNCKFSSPTDNFFNRKGSNPFYRKPILFGKRISIKCEGNSIYGNSYSSFVSFGSKQKFKDGKLLERMLKIGNLDLFSDKNNKEVFFN